MSEPVVPNSQKDADRIDALLAASAKVGIPEKPNYRITVELSLTHAEWRKVSSALRSEIASPRMREALDSEEFHNLCMDYRGANPILAQGAYVRLQQFILKNAAPQAPATARPGLSTSGRPIGSNGPGVSTPVAAAPKTAEVREGGIRYHMTLKFDGFERESEGIFYPPSERP